MLNTRQANLSRLMRQLNGVYTQDFNRRHGLVGHLFQGRLKAVLVDRDAYLLALCRYVERNPVAAGLVRQPSDWPWSSCRAHLGSAPAPDWLDCDGLHGYLLGRPVATPHDRAQAQRRYAALVQQAQDADAGFWQQGLRGQVFLGDEAFVTRMQALLPDTRRTSTEIPRAQRLGPAARMDWPTCLRRCGADRNRALVLAYRQGGHTMSALAREVGLSVAQVSRLIAAGE